MKKPNAPGQVFWLLKTNTRPMGPYPAVVKGFKAVGISLDVIGAELIYYFCDPHRRALKGTRYQYGIVIDKDYRYNSPHLRR